VVAHIDDTSSSNTGNPMQPEQNPLCISKIPNPDSIVMLQEFGWSINCARVLPRCVNAFSANQCNGYQYWQGGTTFDTKTCLGTNSYCDNYVHNGGGNLLFCDGHVKWWATNNLHAGLFGMSPDDPLLPSNVGTYINGSSSTYYSSLF